MTQKELKRYEAKARRQACALARDFVMPTTATNEQVTAVLEAMRDEIATGIRLLAAVSA
jgi:isopentenyl diphosphate isomerase/L-lactate dehydrogenase-like FMN-dependent dehydrogenase